MFHAGSGNEAKLHGLPNWPRGILLIATEHKTERLTLENI